MELSKKDKKAARKIIEIGLQREFEKGLSSFDTILKDWKEKKQDNRESYHLLYKTITDFNRHIARRYDNMTGSKYFSIVAAQRYNGIITQEELKELSEETIQKINFLISQ